MKVSFFFRWYDLWIGAYIDREANTVYICPFPMIGVKVRWHIGPICPNCGYEGDYDDIILHCDEEL